MIEKMTRYDFVVFSGDSASFLSSIQEIGLMDITRSAKPIDKESSNLLERIKGIKGMIGKVSGTQINEASGIDNTVSFDDAEEILNEYSAVHSKIVQAKADLELLRVWGNFDSSEIAKLDELGLKLRFYKVQAKKFNPDWENQVALEIVEKDDKGVYFVTVAPKNEPYSFDIDPVETPEYSYNELESIISRYETEQAGIEARINGLKALIPSKEAECNDLLSQLEIYLADGAAETAAENSISVFKGFAPTSSDEQICKQLDELDAYYVKEAATASDNPPIKLHNNKFAKMFEVLTGMYGMPNYGEFDPTPILGPFFMLFFAMCMGDAGYGILLFIIGAFLGKGSGSMSKFGPLVKALGVGTFVVGIILGTFFGISLPDASWVPEGLKSIMITGEIAGYSAQMALAIGVGVFHICLAMTVKAICHTVQEGFRASVSDWGWLIVVPGGIIIAALSLSGILTSEVTKWIIIVLGVIAGLGIYVFNTPGKNPLLNIGSGLWGTYNMATGLLGDVLSYIRLYALGLAGGMLGAVFNDLGGMIIDGMSVPGLNFLLGAVIMIFGHALNLAMSCLGAFVHPLRLTFVEYFKNVGYQGDGTEYRPLTKNNK